MALRRRAAGEAIRQVQELLPVAIEGVRREEMARSPRGCATPFADARRPGGGLPDAHPDVNARHFFEGFLAGAEGA